jgi:hypothetical protein
VPPIPRRHGPGSGLTPGLQGLPSVPAAVTLPDPPANQVLIYGDSGTVQAWQRDPFLPDGDSYAQWEETARWRRISRLEYAGMPAFTMSGSIFLDYMRAGDGGGMECRTAITTLEQLAGSALVNDAEPAPVRISAPGGAIPHQNAQWVITGLDFKRDTFVVNAHGNPVRVEVGITLKLYTRDEVLAERSAANRRAAARGVSAADRSRRGSYTVRQGDTLMSIARKELGDGDRWKEIADLNDVNDPRKVKVGTRLRMPTTKAKR